MKRHNFNDLIACINKKGYETKSEAKRVINHREAVTENLKLRFYTCPVCKKFHLTSKPRRKNVSSMVNTSR